MKKTGAFLVVYALEQLGIRYTFGIPGVHNTEIYDELGKSELITPMLVTQEGAGAFMADAISRTSDQIGALVIVPAAGTALAMSGIGEAFLDGIPMLIVSGGVRRDSGRHYQLHQIDQGEWLQGITKSYQLVERHQDIVPAIYAAYETATTGEPGPAFVEIPVELQLFKGAIDTLPGYSPPPARESIIDASAIQQAADLLAGAERPGIYVGWGGVDASEETAALADVLTAPVATTLQGLSAMSALHPLHTGVGFGPSSVPAAQKAFKGCDALLAVGVRFSELGTGSYGVTVPETLIHVDINPAVFDKNYPARLTIEADARSVLAALVEELDRRSFQSPRDRSALEQQIMEEKQNYAAGWTERKHPEKVSPGHFFAALRERLDHDAQIVVDDGKHTFLTAELFPVYHPRGFISPTDFNCMGYSIPAAIGAKLVNPDRQVVAIVGDGAFLMTCMETITGVSHGLGVVLFVFHDGELGQISQFQHIPLNKKTCTVLPEIKIEGVALATGAHFVSMKNDDQIEAAMDEALKVSEAGRPVIVDVNIDYERRTLLTKGVVKTNLARFPAGEKVRFVGRALKRHLFG